MLSTLNYYLWGETKLDEPLDKVSFTLNDKQYTIGAQTCPADTTLNTFIRDHALLRGTKFMCREGGCGVCTVYVERQDPINGEKDSLAVNSCLQLVFACHGLVITTIEGIGNRKDGYHPLQKQLAQFNGSQCGMCSPGMVMTMYSLMKSKSGKVSAEEVENALAGNLCRCTGYRPILEAFRSFVTSSEEKMCADIEDFVKICPKKGISCDKKCGALRENSPIKIMFADGREWHKVYQLQDVLNILKQVGDRTYMLVCGNTAHGVYRRNDSIQVFIDVNSVVELHEVSIAETISVGANITLTKLLNVLSEAAAKNPKFSYCTEIIKHIELVAHPMVRNVGSIAGNLWLKNEHPEFQSDISLLLDAVDAKLTTVDLLNQPKVETIAEYISSNARNKVIRTVTFPALDPDLYVFRTFKIIPRAENAFALMNAAFLLQYDTSRVVINDARICFGNISASFSHASQTERFLVGKQLFSNDTLQGAINSLNAELQPDWILPETSAEYRKNLSIALFYKFVLSIASPDLVKPEFRSGATILNRPLSSSKQSYDTNEKYWPLTKEIPKVEGLAQCSGEAEYINDIHPFLNELYAAFVVATKPLSRVVKIEPAEALKMKGVVGCFTAKDIPGVNSFTPKILGFPESEEVLCSGKVLYYGQPVAILVAESFEIANRAAKFVEITYETSQDHDTQLKLNTSEGYPGEATFEMLGEDYGASNLSDTRTITGRMELFGQAHFPLENQTCICVPQESGFDVYPSAQWMGVTQIAIAQLLNIPQNRINLFVRRLGGAFGSKISRQGLTACGAALAAYLTNRPVRFYLLMETHMQLTGKRYGCISDYEVHVDNQGRIFKLSNYFAHNFGCSFNEPVADSFIMIFPNCYENKTWKIIGKMVQTDIPKNTWCRAPASTEAIAAIETIMEHIAQATGADPLDVRLANMPKDSKMRTLIPDYLSRIEFESRRSAINTFNENNRWKKRGIAWVPMKFLTDYHGIFHAFVSINIGDGSVVVTHGGIEMGQGINTKVTQVIAFTLGIPLDMVSVKPSNTWTAANSDPSGGSVTSESVSYAASEACKTLLQRMKPYREQYPNASWFELVQICTVANVDLSISFMFKATDVLPYYIWSLCSAEVEVDILTGNILIRRMDVQEDTGESMSPGIDRGQIEGAIVMGLGYHLAEELIYDDMSGKLLTDRTVNYKILGAKDIPVDFRVNFLKGSSNPCGVLRAKSTSEPPLNLSVVVLFALRNALRSARKDGGLPDAWIPLGTASTPEKIYLKSGNKPEQFLLN